MEGVWAVVDGEKITTVYRNEIEALRLLNGRGFGRVVFVPWGDTVYEVRAREGGERGLVDGKSITMRRMSDEPNAPEPENPYRTTASPNSDNEGAS